MSLKCPSISFRSPNLLALHERQEIWCRGGGRETFNLILGPTACSVCTCVCVCVCVCVCIIMCVCTCMYLSDRERERERERERSTYVSSNHFKRSSCLISAGWVERYLAATPAYTACTHTHTAAVRDQRMSNSYSTLILTT